MTAEVLRPCNACGGTLIATRFDGTGHDWIHKNPLDEADCPHVIAGRIRSTQPKAEETNHPSVLSKQLADVINVDFVNKKRVD